MPFITVPLQTMPQTIAQRSQTVVKFYLNSYVNPNLSTTISLKHIQQLKRELGCSILKQIIQIHATRQTILLFDKNRFWFLINQKQFWVLTRLK